MGVGEMGLNKTLSEQEKNSRKIIILEDEIQRFKDDNAALLDGEPTNEIVQTVKLQLSKKERELERVKRNLSIVRESIDASKLKLKFKIQALMNEIELKKRQLANLKEFADLNGIKYE